MSDAKATVGNIVNAGHHARDDQRANELLDAPLALEIAQGDLRERLEPSPETALQPPRPARHSADHARRLRQADHYLIGLR